MQQSLSPWQDAQRIANASLPHVEEPIHAAVQEACKGLMMTVAKFLDETQEPNDAVSFACSVSASLMEMTARNISQVAPSPRIARRQLLKIMTDEVVGMLKRNAPVHESKTPVNFQPGGTA